MIRLLINWQKKFDLRNQINWLVDIPPPWHSEYICFYELLENERHIETNFIEYLFEWTLNPNLGLFLKHPELSNKTHDIYFEQSWFPKAILVWHPWVLKPLEATAKGNRYIRNICQVGWKLLFESSGHLKKSPRLGFSVCSNWYSMKLVSMWRNEWLCQNKLWGMW